MRRIKSLRTVTMSRLSVLLYKISMTAKFIYLILFIFDLCVYIYFDYYLEIIIMTKFYNIIVGLNDLKHG